MIRERDAKLRVPQSGWLDLSMTGLFFSKQRLNSADVHTCTSTSSTHVYGCILYVGMHGWKDGVITELANS